MPRVIFLALFIGLWLIMAEFIGTGEVPLNTETELNRTSATIISTQTWGEAI